MCPGVLAGAVISYLTARRMGRGFGRFPYRRQVEKIAGELTHPFGFLFHQHNVTGHLAHQFLIGPAK